MADREMVIKGLEKIAEFFKARGDMAVGDGKMLLLSWMRAAEDALALLKAHEPRVMTLEEIPYAVFGWMETFGQIIPCVLEDVYADDTVGFSNVEDGHDYMCASDYGKTWRVWTSKPTEKQREATPWQG